ncbi:MAG TPA: hypothetical protein PLI09_00110 [Candidatus Hydrogenedentes bacterium]|nr:hypothetical protein [Candidatus Hydrogenedentota bacterium]
MQAKRVLIRFFIFALFGLLLEVFFTGMSGAFHGRINLVGHTSPWMMLDYGLLGVIIMPLARPMKKKGVPLAFRAIVYMIGIFAVEYVSGRIFNACGIHIWDYSDMMLNLHGQITLLYAPFWYALGLAAEYLNKKVDAAAVLLMKGCTAEQLETWTPQ